MRDDKARSDDALPATRDALVALSRELGREERRLALLGEGNASARLGDGTFLVKASGASLGALGPDDLCRVSTARVLELLEAPELSEEEVAAGLDAALVGAARGARRRPSVETFLHALCLDLGGARWVGHTHPVAVNRVLCSALGAEPFRRPLFPDGVVVCGRHVAVVPYVDPGFALAKAVAGELRRFRGAHGRGPKLLLLEGHGPVALGATAREVLAVTLMADKWAAVLAGTYALGGPRFLPDEEADRLDARLDEHYRRRALGSEA